jgi:hypothetical protein
VTVSCGTEVGHDLISTVTDGLLAEVTARQARPLEPVYPVVFFDALRVKTREDDVVRNKAVYLALGARRHDNARSGRRNRRCNRTKEGHEQDSGPAVTTFRHIQSHTQWWVRQNYASIRILPTYLLPASFVWRWPHWSGRGSVSIPRSSSRTVAYITDRSIQWRTTSCSRQYPSAAAITDSGGLDPICCQSVAAQISLVA